MAIHEYKNIIERSITYRKVMKVASYCAKMGGTVDVVQTDTRKVNCHRRENGKRKYHTEWRGVFSVRLQWNEKRLSDAK